MARPTSGEKMLDPLPGTAEAKARLAAIMATMSGEKSIPEACAELGIGEARFHEMRKEFLASALGLLERKTAGRKPAEAAEATPERVAELKEEVQTLQVELEASRIRTEIALTMPHLLKQHPRKDDHAAPSAKAGTGIGPLGGKKAKKKKRRR
jgi:transposase-like protein